MTENNIHPMIRHAAAALGLLAFALFLAGTGCSDNSKGVGGDGNGDDTTGIDSISFARDVQPILNTNCSGSACHIPGPEPTTQLSLKDHQSVMDGSADGPILIPRLAKDSEIMKRLEGKSTPRMPLGRGPLPDVLIETIRKWINQGALNN